LWTQSQRLEAIWYSTSIDWVMSRSIDIEEIVVAAVSCQIQKIAYSDPLSTIYVWKTVRRLRNPEWVPVACGKQTRLVIPVVEHHGWEGGLHAKVQKWALIRKT